MRILSMTATFGCLDDQTITFDPGLNVICAPNEWGKSTWCAFLMAMFYGIDTRQRSRQGQLTDKARYQPWSGKPMGGSVDLLWQGRAVTIQRHTQGRIPMGVFRAYETHSGLEIPELTGENCGLKLLGVERGVFARSGFISAGNMAVTQDEDLIRRLNRLVTTGDDNPQITALEGKLRELKNKCRYNQTGALPQAQQELTRCRRDLERQHDLERQAQNLRQELGRQRQWQRRLRDHDEALRAQGDREKLIQVEAARQAETDAAQALAHAAEQCRGLPSMARTAMGIDAWKGLIRERKALELEWAMSPPIQPPEPPECFLGMTPEQAVERARSHMIRLEELRTEARKRGGLACFLTGSILLLAGLSGFFSQPVSPWWMLIPGIMGLILCILGAFRERGRRRSRRALSQWQSRMAESYGDEDPSTLADIFLRLTREAEEREQKRLHHFAARRRMLETRERELDEETLLAAQDSWNAWADAQRAYIRTRSHRRAMETMISGQALCAESTGSDLSLTPEETKTELEKADVACAGLSSRLDACLGQLRALPPVEELELLRQALEERIQKLEQWHDATTLALELLGQARRELQRRFAPHISREAGAVLSGLTGGRYDKLLFDQDFSLLTRGEGESAARESVWRSLGTQEQMYLAVRLAVSRVMIPDAPVILDDALCHFDDERMAAALSCLRTEREQVILFSGQSREKLWLEKQG